MSALFDVEFLQKLTYERSKHWAFVLDKFVAKEGLCDIDINEFSDVYGSDNDESDSCNELASMEENKIDNDPLDSDILRNITNSTRLSLMLNNKTVSAENTDAEQNELIDIFNQTLPIINEHNRQLQEYGFDKILKSFDKNKIEEKVGGWLSRHNSLYSCNNTALELAKSKNCAKGQKAIYAADRSLSSTSASGKETFNDSDDSLQSGETARYIRSSRVSSVKKSAATSTMIKTYRMIKSARESLRKKYACEMDDDKTTYHRKLVNDLQCHRSSYNMMQYYKAHKFDFTPSSSQTRRRKVFRKRSLTYNYGTTSEDSSSDSDFSFEDCRSSRCKNFKLIEHHDSLVEYETCSKGKGTPCTMKRSKCSRSAMKMPSAQRNRLYYFPNSQLKSLSSVPRKRLPIKRKAIHSNDGLPSIEELECHCCDGGKLCRDFKHIANSSKEKWYVENCTSPKQMRKKSTANTEQIRSAICGSVGTGTTQKRLKTKTQKEKGKIKSKTESAKKTLAKSKSATAKSKKDLNEDSENSDLENSYLELHMAIEASKESYESEQQLKSNVERKQEKQTSELLKVRKPVDDVANKIVNDSVEGKTEELYSVSNTDKTDETFFAPTKAVCNSTAVSARSEAYKRQICHRDQKENTGKLQNNAKSDFKPKVKGRKTEISKTKSSTSKKIKSTIAKEGKQIKNANARNNVSSTTIRPPLENDAKLTATQSQTTEEEHNIVYDSDCTLVTSTTNFEQTPKGILIYAPENREMLPGSSTTNNGFFVLTEEYLSRVIGEKQAERLLKSYVGRKRFRLDSTVYYKPIECKTLKDSSSDSDALDYARQYGNFYEETK